jgi:hypothetical protein
LDARDFVEVETPILSPQVGGAIAEPFVTHLRSLVPTPEASVAPVAKAQGMSLFMRIAPELYLKVWLFQVTCTAACQTPHHHHHHHHNSFIHSITPRPEIDVFACTV